MLFALLCTDKPNTAPLRAKTRPEHLIYMDSLGDVLKFAGPFLDDAGTPTGSLVVIETASRSSAEAVAAADPYTRAGIFASVEIKAWRWTLKNPELQ